MPYPSVPDPADLGDPVGDDWVGLSATVLHPDEAHRWAVLPSCGAVVSFTGTSRDHSTAPATGEHREGVTTLEYEAYAEHAVPRRAAVAAEARRRWPAIGRVALWHRTGVVPLGDVSVVVVISTPHRDEAFAAARFALDAIKATVPIWKREVWDDGAGWGLDGQPIAELTTFATGDVPTPAPS